MSSTRLNKYLSQNGYCSRREADRLIEQGRVFVNDRLAHLGDQVSDQDAVRVEGRDRKYTPEKIYLLLNKPSGVTTDARKPNNVLEFIGCPQRIAPVGRLDARDTGLLLLTDDQTLASRLLRAAYAPEEEFVVDVDRALTKLDLGKLQNGVKLESGHTSPTKVRQLTPVRFAIVVPGGSLLQIRPMCEALRYVVVGLMRTRIDTVKIPMSYPQGSWRRLTKSEVHALKKMAGME